jgi:hypothetical protein
MPALPGGLGTGFVATFISGSEDKLEFRSSLALEEMDRGDGSVRVRGGTGLVGVSGSDEPSAWLVGARRRSAGFLGPYFRLGFDGAAPTVLLLAILFSCTMSGNVSSTGLGRRACAIASGPASAGKNGAATPASIMLERTVTGNTFALMSSRRMLSAGPKMTCWTLLNIRLQVLKCSDWGLEDKSWRYVWKSQKV